MKVVICAHDIPHHEASGPNSWLKRFAKYFSETDVQLYVLFIHFGQVEDCPTIQYFVKNDLIHASVGHNELLYTEEKIKWILNKVNEIQPDVFIPNVVVPAMYASKLIKESNIPTIGVIHSYDAFHLAIINQFLKKKSYLFSALVCVSEYTKFLAEKNNKYKIQIEKIPCGAPVPDLKTKKPDKKLNVVYIGKIAQKPKRILDIANAFCKLTNEYKNITASIYGSGPDVNKVQEIISSTHALNTKYGGSINSNEIQRILANYHIVVLLSEYEGLPIALLESMAVGIVPVCLAVEHSGVNEVIENGKNGILIENKEDLIPEIIKLKNDPQRWKDLSLAAVKTVELHYSTKVSNMKWEEIFNSFSENRENSKKIVLPRKIVLPKVLEGFKREDFRKSETRNSIIISYIKKLKTKLKVLLSN